MPDIKLPPLPESDGEIEVAMAGRLVPIVVYRPSTVHDYARAAVLADRERRAQPAPPDDALRQDAERYRWLRDHGFQHAVVCLGTDLDGDNFVSYRIDFNLPEPAHMKFEDDEWGTADVDAAIDAAMRKEERHDNQ